MLGVEVLFREPTASQVRSLMRRAGVCPCCDGDVTCRLLAMLAAADARHHRDDADRKRSA